MQYDRSQLVSDARALLGRAVEAIAQAREHKQRSDEILRTSAEHVVWSDHLIGESRLIAERLHETVATIATQLRTNGAPPEKVLTLLKSFVIDAEADRLEGAVARSLIEDVVRWGIEGYYAA
jgi:hypothetical protein